MAKPRLIPETIERLLSGKEISVGADYIPEDWQKNPDIEYDGLKCIIMDVEGQMTRHGIEWTASIKAYPNQTYYVEV